MKMIPLIAVATMLTLLSACAPEVGSEKWCAKMKETPKGEWSMNDTRDYTKYCVLNIEQEE